MPRSPGCSRRHIPEEWSVTDCMRILRRRKATLLWITCMGALGAVLITQRDNPAFTNRGRRSRSRRSTRIFSISATSTRPRPRASTRDYTCRHRWSCFNRTLLIEEVARKLHLEEQPEFQPPSALPEQTSPAHKDCALAEQPHRPGCLRCARRRSSRPTSRTRWPETFIEQSIESRQRAARQTYESLRQQLDETQA